MRFPKEYIWLIILKYKRISYLNYANTNEDKAVIIIIPEECNEWLATNQLMIITKLEYEPVQHTNV